MSNAVVRFRPGSHITSVDSIRFESVQNITGHFRKPADKVNLVVPFSCFLPLFELKRPSRTKRSHYIYHETILGQRVDMLTQCYRPMFQWFARRYHPPGFSVLTNLHQGASGVDSQANIFFSRSPGAQHAWEMSGERGGRHQPGHRHIKLSAVIGVSPFRVHTANADCIMESISTS